jgi:hypothetical protein
MLARSRSSALDWLRQALNVVLCVTHVLAPGLYLLGIGTRIGTAYEPGRNLVEPVSWAFSIWGLIYPATIAYAIYQALPSQRENELLRRIGFFTATTFLASTAWSVVAQLQEQAATQALMLWVTVGLIFAMLASLIGVLVEFIEHRAPLRKAERYLVMAPFSVFAAWVAIATIPNTASALRVSGFRNVLVPDTSWAVMMVVFAGLIGAFVTQASRGNAWWALTFVWGLLGILAENVLRGEIEVALTSGCMAALVVLSFLGAGARPRLDALLDHRASPPMRR